MSAKCICCVDIRLNCVWCCAHVSVLLSKISLFAGVMPEGLLKHVPFFWTPEVLVNFWLIYLFEESVWIPRVCMCRCDVWCWSVKIFWNMLHFQMVFGRGRCWLISGLFIWGFGLNLKGLYVIYCLLVCRTVDTVDEKVFLHVRLLYAAYVGLDQMSIFYDLPYLGEARWTASSWVSDFSVIYRTLGIEEMRILSPGQKKKEIGFCRQHIKIRLSGGHYENVYLFKAHYIN